MIIIVAVFKKRLLTDISKFSEVILRQVPDCGAPVLVASLRWMHKTKTDLDLL